MSSYLRFSLTHMVMREKCYQTVPNSEVCHSIINMSGAHAVINIQYTSPRDTHPATDRR